MKHIGIRIDASHPPPSSFALRSLTTPSQRCWYEEVVRYQRMLVGGLDVLYEISFNYLRLRSKGFVKAARSVFDWWSDCFRKAFFKFVFCAPTFRILKIIGRGARAPGSFRTVVRDGLITTQKKWGQV